MSAQYVFNLTVQLGCPLPVRDNLNKYVYSTTRIGNFWYIEPEPTQAEFVYAVLYRLALLLSEITVYYSIYSITVLRIRIRSDPVFFGHLDLNPDPEK